MGQGQGVQDGGGARGWRTGVGQGQGQGLEERGGDRQHGKGSLVTCQAGCCPGFMAYKADRAAAACGSRPQSSSARKADSINIWLNASAFLPRLCCPLPPPPYCTLHHGVPPGTCTPLYPSPREHHQVPVPYMAYSTGTYLYPG